MHLKGTPRLGTPHIGRLAETGRELGVCVEDVDNGAIREDGHTDTWQNPKEMREAVVWVA